VPCALQHVQQELVQDGLGTARTLNDHAGDGVQRGGVGPTWTQQHSRHNPSVMAK
jgi:hypothetical protein